MCRPAPQRKDTALVIRSGQMPFLRVASPRPVATGEARLSSRCRAPEALREIPPQPSYLVTLSEGRNRQIRRTFAALGYKVVKLHRIAFGKYELSGLEPGKCVIIKP